MTISIEPLLSALIDRIEHNHDRDRIHTFVFVTSRRAGDAIARYPNELCEMLGATLGRKPHPEDTVKLVHGEEFLGVLRLLPPSLAELIVSNE